MTFDLCLAELWFIQAHLEPFGGQNLVLILWKSHISFLASKLSASRIYTRHT